MRKISDEEFVTDECREYALDDVLIFQWSVVWTMV